MPDVPEKMAPKNQTPEGLSSQLTKDLLSVLQNPGALPPLEEPSKSPVNFTPEFKMPALPTAPEEPPGPGTGVRIGRALSVFLAAAGGHPELASLLTQRFAEQDQAAAEQVQLDFANKMAIVQAQRQELNFQADEAQREIGNKQTAEQQRLTRQSMAQDRARTQLTTAIDALNLVQRQKEFEASNAAAGGRNDDVARLRLEMDQIQFMRQSLQDRVKEIGGEVPKDLATNPLAQINILGQEEFLRRQKAGESTYEAALAKMEGKRAFALEQEKGKFAASPAFQQWKASLTPNGQMLADQFVGALPNPVTGDTGSQEAFGQSVVGLAGETTTDGRNALIAANGEMAKTLVAQGSFATQQEAEEFLAGLVHNHIPTDEWVRHIPPAGTIKVDLRRLPPEAFTPQPGLHRTNLRGKGPPPKPIEVKPRGR